MPTVNFNFPDIHQGTPFLYVLPGGPPAANTPLIIDANGNPPGTSQPFFMGSSQAPCTFHVSYKSEKIEIDQETAPVDALMTAEDAYIEMVLKEMDLLKVNFALPHVQYSAGSNASLPTGVQNYQMMTFGGLATIPKYAVCLISPRRGTNNTKFFVGCLYNAFASDPFQIDITRTKESLYKVRFNGLALPSRPLQDRVGQWYRQL
jgi:hypothetical protein